MKVSKQTVRRFLGCIAALAMVLAVLLTASSPAGAVGGTRGDLNGTVVDQTTGTPIVGAQVDLTAPSGTFTTTTNGQGYFSFLGIPVDTYTLTIKALDHQPTTISGITLIGDGTIALGKVQMSRREIARILTRAQNGAFQPTQTQDVSQVSGQRIEQTLGKAAGTSEQNLILAAPGVILDNAGNLSVRGSLTVELGYQFDGVPFNAPFFGASGNQGFITGIGGPNGGSLQVVSGAGDATTGNNGGGTINLIPPRGQYPGTGLIDFEAGSPIYAHQFALQYGIATPNGRFSDYFSTTVTRFVPNVNLPGYSAADLGLYQAAGYNVQNDLLNNLVYRFGKGNNQSLQLLTRWAGIDSFGNYGGLGVASFYTTDPFWLDAFKSQFPGSSNTIVGTLPNGTPLSQNAAYFQMVQPLLPNVTANAGLLTQPEEINNQPLNFLKIGYTRNLNPTTFFNADFYNWGLFQGNEGYTQAIVNPFNVLNQHVGGRRVGYIAALTHAFGSKHTVTLEGKWENGFPFWDNQSAAFSPFALELNRVALPNSDPSFPGLDLRTTRPLLDDWFLPANPTLASTGGGGANPCIGRNNAPDPVGCYIHDQMVAKGLWNGTLPRLPMFGLGYGNTDFQQFGVALRDQFSPTDRLHIDFGGRIDGTTMKFATNSFSSDPFGNPSDVGPEKITNSFLRPNFFEPRFAAAYQMGDNDALRFSYGRSVNFFFAQTSGTPWRMPVFDPVFNQIAPKDTAALPGCGSGWHGLGTVNGHVYMPNPDLNYSGVQQGPTAVGSFFQCSSYAQQLFWTGDQWLDAPDLGGFAPPTFSNFDLAYTHQFTKGQLRGWGVKMTGFTRRGYNVEQNTLLQNGPPNPVTGQVSASVFSTLANGIEKTAGIEFGLTTPDVPEGRTGISGFLTADYINELENVPPVAGSDTLPIINQFLFNSGQLFHVGFLPPLSGRIGVTYHTAAGWAITPIISANNGYPFGVGASTLGFVNGQLGSLPQNNINTPYAGPQGPGNAFNASNYVDPANPGGLLDPNIAATRGYDEPAIAGQKFTRPHAQLDLVVQYTANHLNTYGVQIFNVFNDRFGIPVVNTLWQPVATGVGGPQTGLSAAAFPGTPTYTFGARDQFGPAGGLTDPYIHGFGLGTSFQFYFQRRI